MVAIGKKRHRATMKTITEAVNATTGQTEETTTTVGTTWASVEPLRADEQLSGIRLERPVTHRIKTRWRDIYEPVTRIVVKGVTHRVRGVENKDFVKRELEFLTETGSDI